MNLAPERSPQLCALEALTKSNYEHSTRSVEEFSPAFQGQESDPLLRCIASATLECETGFIRSLRDTN